MPKRIPTRDEALLVLKEHGITGHQVYLLSCIPLIDMMWADGNAQEPELRLLEQFVRKKVENLSTLAGQTVVTYEQAWAFCQRFLVRRPDHSVLHVLSELVRVLEFSSPDTQSNAKNRQAVLDWCMDVAASAVTEYPYGDRDRFNAAEKACFAEVVATLSA